jgi:F0F1-type ATP synthase assembly protein I
MACEINYSTNYLFEFTPWHFIILELIGIGFIFFFMRKIQAKTD